ncbi:hypothetical protein R8Z57_00320 [Microbacterium sp. M3]|uniref:Uncharacterized protein n=1 Tax=Microbacterium arthrosphaerae TaxID=792652 RepID=A0ABU4GVX1_9MICO|nr:MULTISPECIES: hypothetical protein [Microbacterium]MDW4571218.1 hypothetical protein [Microbacterium arthrosphaerae]MDW7605073.1 hypothetical protein [Microbacterium sp. M3]
MEARTGLVIGGMTAVGASIAVVTAVALANTAALADAPGTSVSAGRVVVPSAEAPTATPRATPATAPTAAPETTPPAAAGPETVSAPDPVFVDRPRIVVDQSPAPAPAAPAAPPAPPAAPPADLDAVIAAAKASGSWDDLRRWASEQGWSGGRIEQLVSRLEEERSNQSGQGGQEWLPSPDDSGDRQGLVGPGSTSDRPGNSPQDQKKNPPQRPAHAGSNAGHGDDAGPGPKKDQSRDSPDRRD